ncbi:MAG: TIGR02147 family protein [Polyangiaceae bacterium]|nr:TIGR02147 family protein [Polyangiaceae bacterium]
MPPVAAGPASDSAPSSDGPAPAPPRPPPRVPSVYEYVDYRAFLRDHFAASKILKPQYSYRYFSRRAGLASSNFLKLVMDGKRNLGAGTIECFARALKLDDAESRFFADLVGLSQAETLVERNRAFERVAANRRFRAARRLEGPLFEYLRHWYYPVVRELAARADFVDDPRWLAGELLPPVTVREARAALDVLGRLGLLVRDASGRLVRGEPSLTTGHEVRSAMVPVYHRQMIERAGAAVDDVPPDERDVSALTVCIRASSLADLKQRIRRFREEMMERCDTETEPERVYQLCIQLFPLSRGPPSAPPVGTAPPRPESPPRGGAKPRGARGRPGG